MHHQLHAFTDEHLDVRGLERKPRCGDLDYAGRLRAGFV
jgi:hypothetical protein